MAERIPQLKGLWNAAAGTCNFIAAKAACWAARPDRPTGDNVRPAAIGGQRKGGTKAALSGSANTV
ncbi:hypothetical protein AB838_02480 [Rhodobacteraceae bacterium (ex Bugula neritina AB1)]|nr:hypothetical protein AB838_02480 [Rhodobacteraceae bacterium (ex Bugula neritina AB1)]